DLRLDAVAARHGDLTHVHAAEAHDLQSPRFGDRAGDAGPAFEIGDDIAVLPVPNHDLVFEAQSRDDEPELAVAVGRLVQVHEVHVDLGPGQLAVEDRKSTRL